MSGGSLAEVIRLGPSWWTGTAKSIVIVGIVLGMAEAHRINIMHCSLKSDSILLDDRHRPRISGFGAGDVHYGAPDDVFSFGVILYQVVVGALGNSEVEIPDSVGEFARGLIRQCCAQKPAERPSFAQISEQLQRHHFRIDTNGFNEDEVRVYVEWVRKCDWARSIPALPLNRTALRKKSGGQVLSSSALRFLSPKPPPIISPVAWGRGRGRRGK
jgi:serine/threonine protein kinase